MDVPICRIDGGNDDSHGYILQMRFELRPSSCGKLINEDLADHQLVEE